MSNRRTIEGKQAWLDFIHQGRGALSICLTDSGIPLKQAKLIVQITTAQGQMIKAHGHETHLRQIGEALPDLMEFAGQDVFFTPMVSDTNLFTLAFYNKHLAKAINETPDFIPLDQDWEWNEGLVSYHFRNIHKKSLGLAVQQTSPSSHGRASFILWDHLQFMRSTPTQSTASATRLHPRHIEHPILTPRDNFLTTLAHEAGHIKLNHGSEWLLERRKKEISYESVINGDYGACDDWFTKDDYNIVLTLEREIAADRQAIEFTNKYPNLFTKNAADLFKLFRCKNFIFPLTHATYLALDQLNPPQYGTEQSFREALKIHHANKRVGHEITHRIAMSDDYVYSRSLPHKTSLGAIKMADQTLKENKFATQSPERRILQDPERRILQAYLDQIRKVAPTLVKKVTQDSGKQLKRRPLRFGL